MVNNFKSTDPTVASLTYVINPSVTVVYKNPLTIIIQAVDALGRNQTNATDVFTISIIGAIQGSFTIINNGDGTYNLTLIPLLPGYYIISIVLNGIPISGSPYSILVTGNSLLFLCIISF